jgi:hypothetical protein
MNTLRILSVILVTALVACGGGGGGGGGNNVDPANDYSGEDGSQSPEDPELVFQFSNAPLTPKVFNLSPLSSADNHFNPGDTVNMFWNVDIYYSDNSSISSTEHYTYDGTVFLSEDTNIHDDDLTLFSIECALPGSPDDACSNNASFQCTYAANNENTMACTSIPLNKTNGFSDLSIDTSEWLDTVPKSGFVIFQACLHDESADCVEFSYPIQLN